MKRPRAGILAAAALVVACARSAPRNEASDVANRFVDYYFVEIDQERALPLTTGPAHEQLEKELADTRAVRESGYRPQDAKGTVSYARTYFKEDAASGMARSIYDLQMEHGRDKTQHHVLVSLHRLDRGQWRVSSFTVREGSAPRAPSP